MIDLKCPGFVLDRQISDLLFGLMKAFKFNPLRARRLLSSGEKLAEEKTFANFDGSVVLLLAVARNGVACDCQVTVTRDGVTDRVIISHSQTRQGWDWEKKDGVIVPITSPEVFDLLVRRLDRLLA